MSVDDLALHRIVDLEKENRVLKAENEKLMKRLSESALNCLNLRERLKHR